MVDEKKTDDTESDVTATDPDDFVGVSHAYENAANETDVPRYADDEERQKFKDACYMQTEVVGGEGYKPFGEHDEKAVDDEQSKVKEKEAEIPKVEEPKLEAPKKAAAPMPPPLTQEKK